jgi:translation initiation factor 2 subunit 2
MLMDYEKLLDKGLKELPEESGKNERFEIPKVKGHIQGNKTIIVNFLQLADIFRRDSGHFLKFLLRELAAPGSLKDKRLILGRKISASLINDKIELYAKNFVLCKECRKPDTQILKEGKINILRCTACGARHSIRTKI